MDKNSPPESFGAFKPVNHVVIALPSADAVDAAARELEEAGIGEIVQYTPEDMIRQADQELANASSVAAVGQELNLVRAHRELALKGHGFLVVPAGDDSQLSRIKEIAQRHRAARTQRYGRFIIEELMEVGEGLTQVGESPARGLDAQTVTGTEPQGDKQR